MRKIAKLSIVIVGCTIVGSLAFVQVQKVKAAAAYSTTVSLYAALKNSGTLRTTATNWQVLANAEYDQTVSQAASQASIDVGRTGWTTGGVLVDPWKKRLHIAIRTIEEAEYEYIVWSEGADGISGTSDDIVVPQGARLPPP